MKLKGKDIVIADIEADGLLDTITKIYTFSYARQNADGAWEIKTVYTEKGIQEILGDENIYVVGHNFINYDIPAINKIYPNIEVKSSIIDSLFLSYGLFEDRLLHGLESWGDTFNVEKTKVEDHQWKEGDLELMTIRCEQDVRINTNMFFSAWKLLQELYDGDEDVISNYINYLNIQAEISYECEVNPFTLNVEQAKENYRILQEKIDEITSILQEKMPKVPIVKTKTKPAKMRKKDATLSKRGQEWVDFLKEVGLPEDHEDPVDYISGYEEPNPGSVQQIKDWFFSLGWEPQIYKKTFLKSGEENNVPQIKDGKKLCPSVLKLAEKVEDIKYYKEYTILIHRLGYIKGFLEVSDETGGFIPCRMGGLTATTRWKHRKPVANMISKDAAYGEFVRPLLCAPKGYKVIGSDISGLENYVGVNYTYSWKPDILDKLEDKNFDPHLETGLYTSIMTQEEVDRFVELKAIKKQCDEDKTSFEFEDEYIKLTGKRSDAKVISYAISYGAGIQKIADSLNTTSYKAKKIKEGYWNLNHNVVSFTDTLESKMTSDGRSWLKLPLNGFYVPLRSDHKKYNTCIQSTGMYIFTLWTYFIRKYGYKISHFYHDEVAIILPEEDVEECKIYLHKAMERVNNIFKFAAPIGISIDVGDNYGETH